MAEIHVRSAFAVIEVCLSSAAGPNTVRRTPPSVQLRCATPDTYPAISPVVQHDGLGSAGEERMEYGRFRKRSAWRR